MEYINSILGLAVIGNMIAHWFQPIQNTKRRFINLFSKVPFFHSVLDKSFNCSKCMSFWIYLIVYQNIVGAALCSFIGLLINFIIDKIQEWYE